MSVSFHPEIKHWYPDYAKDPAKEFSFMEARLSDADLVLRFLLQGRRRIVVQAGAHIGRWPMRLAKSFEHVFAFEPEPDLFTCAKLNIAWHDTERNITLLDAALGKEQGQARFRRHPSPGRCQLDETGPHTVQMVKLDAVMAGYPIDALVLDVEGREADVLEGAKELIDEHSPVIQVEMLERSRQGIYDYLTAIGYKLVTKSHADAVFTR